MNNNSFKIGNNIVWTLLIGHLLFISIGAFAKIMHWEYWQPVLVLGLLCLISSWLFIFVDMIRSNFYNRTFWLMSMFILPTISPVFYMIRREKLIRNVNLD